MQLQVHIMIFIAALINSYFGQEYLATNNMQWSAGATPTKVRLLNCEYHHMVNMLLGWKFSQSGCHGDNS